MEKKRKLLYWEGSSKKGFKEFPIDVQKDMGVALFVVQLGGTPDSAKLWKGQENIMNRNEHPQGTDNVLLDLGLDDAEELSAKAALALKLNKLIGQRGLNQTAAAAITGMTQPKVSQVRRYKLQNISLERLMQALVSLDQHVEIVVQPARRAHAPGITVAA